MVTFKKARQGYKFSLTATGLELGKIRTKYEVGNVNKKLYEQTVPTAWITKGYVQEVKIDG